CRYWAFSRRDHSPHRHRRSSADGGVCRRLPQVLPRAEPAHSVRVLAPNRFGGEFELVDHTSVSCEAASSAKSAKSANAFLLADLAAVGGWLERDVPPSRAAAACCW